MKVAVLCGGVGAARFLRGLIDVVDQAGVTAIVNTGDDVELHGLAISPDIDTIVYTLAGAIAPSRGWGLAGETWRAMEAMARYTGVRPDGSQAAATWFNLGDADLATHMYRTARRAEGATLTQVTAEIARAWNLGLEILPMSDSPFRTLVTLAADELADLPGGNSLTGRTISFQEYFVRLAHSVPITAVRFDGSGARLAPPARAALENADVIVVAPSNPLVSIGPIRALPGVDELLAERRADVVAVSPIVAGAAIKGPADRMLAELGTEPSVVGVAQLYSPIASVLVIDPADAHRAAEVERTGMRCLVEPSIMDSPTRAEALARATVQAVAG